MGLKIEYLSVDSLVAYERNARQHSGDQVDQIVASINEFGFTNPVLIDVDNILIAGHGRVQAAKLAGLAEVPAIRLLGLSDSQKKALRIADNQLPLNASWDMDLLMDEVQSLDLEDFDLEVLGFDSNLLGTLLADNDGSDEVEPGVSENSSDSVVKYLTIDNEKVPMTEQDAEQLLQLLEKYIKQYGTNFGFASRIVDRLKAKG